MPSGKVYSCDIMHLWRGGVRPSSRYMVGWLPKCCSSGDTLLPCGGRCLCNDALMDGISWHRTSRGDAPRYNELGWLLPGSQGADCRRGCRPVRHSRRRGRAAQRPQLSASCGLRRRRWYGSSSLQGLGPAEPSHRQRYRRRGERWNVSSVVDRIPLQRALAPRDFAPAQRFSSLRFTGFDRKAPHALVERKSNVAEHNLSRLRFFSLNSRSPRQAYRRVP